MPVPPLRQFVKIITEIFSLRNEEMIWYSTYMQPQQSNSVFLVETNKIVPNPHQPRHEFNEFKLKELADSIRAYGILQPLVVIRKEREVPTGTQVEYELIAGERRLRAARLAGILQVPVIIRQDTPEQVKLELALIENVQREDLNAIDRAKAFKQLMDAFDLSQKEIASRIGKSREFIANSIRILGLPDYIKDALLQGKIHEGHTRPLLMLSDRPEAQERMLQEIILKQLSVRDTEKLARRVAYDRARKKDDIPDANTRELEHILSNALGTRVSIERKGTGGRIAIDFFSSEDLQTLLAKVSQQDIPTGLTTPEERPDPFEELEKEHAGTPSPEPPPDTQSEDERDPNQSKANDEDLKNFTV
ncbi:MAG: hypothetical protein COU47_01185 [Candidatus Niyogibacteria bacterium CG10_big_fil_rev_8_21_14_0_10_46_36]|uniref:ParB-like N-terminal domain-containing protein n=1 Tax=Candidatus Niyogibacteria bacterium CG10_big_fil_rev_8_21_14_0_10_46_36 TaxID=1974726 RepID=A0A2H0TDR2_9BACT|nr:MAG: hypothetical protein COU47_01185 [Candidatus Niyogibacteria bacterium CG10_big_fil_rev_8_21_14_0_10_46_36]